MNCTHNFIYSKGEWVCRFCGIVKEEQDGYKAFFDKLHGIYHTEGKITYWNRKFCLGSRPVKKYKFAYRAMLMRDREYREYRILVWLEEKYKISSYDLNKIKKEFEGVKKLTKRKIQEIVKKYLNSTQLLEFSHQFSL